MGRGGKGGKKKWRKREGKKAIYLFLNLNLYFYKYKFYKFLNLNLFIFCLVLVWGLFVCLALFAINRHHSTNNVPAMERVTDFSVVLLLNVSSFSLMSMNHFY